MKTLEERIEAAIKTVLNSGIGTIYDVVKPLDIAAMLRNAFPELFDGSHVLLPREPTEEMIERQARVIASEASGGTLGWEDYDSDEEEEFMELARHRYLQSISAYESNQGP